MKLFHRLVHSNFYIKLTNWEYWPFGIVQAPFFIYWLWLSLKARSIFFFSASNPSITMGGMMGESKYDVLKLVPDELKPKTIYISLPATPDEVESKIRLAGLNYPVIFKPDLGERGWMVRRIHDIKDITVYLSEIRIDFLVQELVDLPLEFGVFYVRHPSKEKGEVNSITAKDFLSVTGDGRKTLPQLILQKDRAKLQWQTLQHTYHHRLDEVIAAGKSIELVSVGNHCLGTTFLNGNHLITPRLNDSFNRISNQINGFYFGRYDLRCASLHDLENGKVKIVELNGCGAEPAHIYHPGASLREALRVLYRHWKNLYEISRENHRRGTAYLSFAEGRSHYKRFRALKKA